jgi:glycosyltransferase involved in cell wall biosynthesis
MSRIKSVTVVVPCYNAGERLAPVVHALVETVAHVLLVDDGSTDGAPQRAAQETGAELLELPQNQGKGFAMLAGFKAALKRPETDCVCIVDADGQHDPTEIPGLYATMQETNADLVIGSRTFDQDDVPWRSRFGNKLTAAITRVLLGRRIQDTQSGFRLHSRKFLEYVLETVPGGRYETEMEILVRAVRRGYTVVPAPIKTIYEEGNPSSHFNKLRDSFRIYHRLFVVALRVRSA